MAKQIKFKYDGKDYTLEFTRRSIETMEKQGFSMSNISDRPMSALPQLFSGAFMAHHKFEKQEVKDKIFAGLRNREELFSTLVDMYNEPIVALMSEPDDDEGNVEWTTEG